MSTIDKDPVDDVRNMLDRLRTIDKLISEGDSLINILEYVLGTVAKVMKKVDEGSILLLQPRTDILESIVAFGENANLRRGIEIKRGDISHVRDVFDSVLDVSPLLNNVRQARASGKHYMTVSEKTEHELDIKIGVFGVLNLESNSAERPFSEIDLKNAELLAGQALIAVQNWETLNQRKSLSEMQRHIAMMSDGQIIGDELFTKLLDAACHLNGAKYGSLFILDESEHGNNGNFSQLVRFGEIPPRIERLHRDTIRLADEKTGIVGWLVNKWLHSVKSGKSDLQSENIGDIRIAPWNKMYRIYFQDTRSELVVPLFAKRDGENPQLLGAMNFESPDSNFFTDSDKKITQEFAQMCVIVLNQTRGQYYRMISEALHRIDNEIIEGLNRDDDRRQQATAGRITSEYADQQAENDNGRALSVALNEVQRMFNASRAVLYVFDARRRRTRIYQSGNFENFKLPDTFYPVPQGFNETFPIPLGNTLVDYLILREDQVKFRLFDRVLDANENILGGAVPKGIESAMAVKVSDSAETLGILYIESVNKNQFLADDLDNLEKFVRQIQLAYQLTYRVESLQRSRKRLSVLREVAGDLTRVQTQNEAYELVFNAACKMIKSKTRISSRLAATIRLYNRDTRVLEVFLVFQENLNLHVMQIEIGKGVTGYVVERERRRLRELSSNSEIQLNLITIGNYSIDSQRYWDDIAVRGNHVLPPGSVIRSILAVPIIALNKRGIPHLYGVLTLTSNEYYYFSRGDEDFMRTLVVLLLDSLRRIEQTAEEDTIQLGMLAYDLTHPLSKPVTTMSPSIDLLEKRLKALGIQHDDKIKLELDTLKKQIADWNSVTAQIKEVVALRDIRRDNFETFDAIALFKKVRDNVEDIYSTLNPEPRVTLVFDAIQPDIKNFKAEISEYYFIRAIGNLVKNSIEALSDRRNGTISITLTDDGRGDCLFLRIIDNGPGIDPDILLKIFERGVTTKGDQGGSGLGMWLVKLYLRLQSIDIITENQEAPSQGARFTLVIPISRQS